jgi:haloacetate dehalogenase
VLPDLRGYGDSSKPDGGADHSAYSFRSMALDQTEVMRHLGFDKFVVAGHDRGAWVLHRLASIIPMRSPARCSSTCCRSIICSTT